MHALRHLSRAISLLNWNQAFASKLPKANMWHVVLYELKHAHKVNGSEMNILIFT